MICHRDKTFCASSGTCVRRDCYRWLDFGGQYDLPVSLAEYRDSDECPGYEQHPALTTLKQAFKPASA